MHWANFAYMPFIITDRHWARGSCRLGEACNFVHSGKAGVQILCRHFLRGPSCCPRGDTCDFKHQLPQPTAFVPQQAPNYAPYLNPSPHRRGVPGIPRDQHAHIQPGIPQYSRLQPGIPQHAHLRPGIPQHVHHQQMTSSSYSPQIMPPRPTTGDQRVCRHYANGFCRLGDLCGFAHIGEVSSTPKPRVVCRHFARGHCNLGNKCGFLHATADTTTAPGPSVSAAQQIMTLPSIRHAAPTSVQYPGQHPAVQNPGQSSSARMGYLDHQITTAVPYPAQLSTASSSYYSEDRPEYDYSEDRQQYYY